MGEGNREAEKLAAKRPRKAALAWWIWRRFAPSSTGRRGRGIGAALKRWRRRKSLRSGCIGSFRWARRNGDISTWALFLSDLTALRREQSAKRGGGLRFLTETVTSPTLAAQLGELLKKLPSAKWHQYEPVNFDEVHEGARQAFGEIVA